MTEIDVLFASVAVSDLDAAIAWYTAVLGRAPDIVPNDEEVMWRLTESAWLYVIRDNERACRSVVTMCVRDLDAALAEMRLRGLGQTTVESVGDSGRKAKFSDPDGNKVSFIEVTGGDQT